MDEISYHGQTTEDMAFHDANSGATDISGEAISRILCSDNGIIASRIGRRPFILLLPSQGRQQTYCDQPETAPDITSGIRRAARDSFLFDLAPGGVCPAPDIAVGAVVSYTAISPLPRLPPRGNCGAVSFLWHFPCPAHYRGIPRHYAGAPCPLESGLSSPPPRAKNAREAERPSTSTADIQQLMIEDMD